MESSDFINLLILIVLLSMSGVFSSAETSMVTVNTIKIRNQAEKGSSTAKMLLKIKNNPDKMLSAILIGNNLVNLSASSLATTLTIKIFGSHLVGVATGILTILILIFGEITPKTMAARDAEKMAYIYARPIYYLMYFMTPIIWVVNMASQGIIRFLGGNANQKREAFTEDELRTILNVSHEEGILEKEERKMINNVFDFGDIVAKDIMIPRIDMTMVDVEASYEELIQIVEKEMYTRMPVFEGSTDNVVGIINVKELLFVKDKDKFVMKECMRPAFFTYEYKKIAELMIEMRNTFSNIVIVLDEYGATAGMITTEDMIEEIVGEIRDEYDREEEENIVRLEQGEYFIDGSMRLDDLNEELGTDFYSDDYESIGGFIIGKLDHIPVAGEQIVYAGITLIVEKMDKARIEKVRLCMPKK